MLRIIVSSLSLISNQNHKRFSRKRKLTVFGPVIGIVSTALFSDGPQGTRRAWCCPQTSPSMCLSCCLFKSRYPSAPVLPLSPIVSWNPTSPIFLEKFSVHIVSRKLPSRTETQGNQAAGVDSALESWESRQQSSRDGRG